MRHVGYNPIPDNPDMCIKTKMYTYGYIYYYYILCNVDGILVIHNDAMSILNKINKYFKLNPNSIGGTDMYLGSKIHYHRTNNGV